jgi:hypothetical protein
VFEILARSRVPPTSGKVDQMARDRRSPSGPPDAKWADADPETVIGERLMRKPADVALIVRGAAMLCTADAGTAAECLATR